MADATLDRISDPEWAALAPLLPPERGRRGRPARCNRALVEAIVEIMLSGEPWMRLAARHGRWNTAYRRWWRWRQAGVFSSALVALEGDQRLSYRVREALRLAAEGERSAGRPALRRNAAAAESAHAPR